MNTGLTLPGGWTIRSLRSCLRTAPEYGINAAAVPFEAGLPTYLRITDISDDNRFRPSPRVSIKHPDATAYFLKEGDLVFARTGASVGKSYLYNPNDGPLVFAGFLIRVSPNPEDVQPVFLAYCAQSERYWDWVATMSSRSGQPGINGQEYGTFQLLLPSSDEQRAVAEALSDVDGLIESLESLIAKKRAVKTATIQQLLTRKTRLPDFCGKWDLKQLKDVVSIRDRKVLPSDVSPETPCVELDHIKQDDGQLVGHSTAQRSTASKYCFLAGDVLFGRLRPYLRKFWHADINGICTTEIWPLAVDPEKMDGGFLNIVVQSESFIETTNISYGTHMPRADWNIVRNFEFSSPPLEEQRAIANVHRDIDAEIATLEQYRNKAHAVKYGMVQQLLTGKIRLVESVETTTRPVSTASTGKGHNWQFNEAVVIAVLAGRFGSEEYPLGRMRYTKLSYLLHRHVEGRAEGYLKKAAGPYNPRTRYGGPEEIALKNHYVRRHKNGNYAGFIAGEDIEKAEDYFVKWYGEDCLKWLNQFRYERSGDLELLTTVDLAAGELREAGKDISVDSVREAIRSDPEWKAKLNRSIFSGTNIARAIEKRRKLFDPGHERPQP